MSAIKDHTEVRLKVYESAWPRVYPGQWFRRYTGHIVVDKVSGIEIPERDFSETIKQSPEFTHLRTLIIPTSWIDGLISSVNSMAAQDVFNCHRFTRRVLGLPGDEGEAEGSPIVSSINGLAKVETIGPGDVAVIGIASDDHDEVFHSLLGAKEGLSLQVMDAASELAVAKTNDVLDYYRIDAPEAGLYLIKL